MAEDQWRRERVRGSGSRLGIEERWPELLESLDPAQRQTVVQSLEAAWRAGWVPNREDVENLTDKERGAIDGEEYQRRTREAAERGRRVKQAVSSFEIEGVRVSSEARADAREFVAGRIELEELHERAHARRRQAQERP